MTAALQHHASAELANPDDQTIGAAAIGGAGIGALTATLVHGRGAGRLTSTLLGALVGGIGFLGLQYARDQTSLRKMSEQPVVDIMVLVGSAAVTGAIIGAIASSTDRARSAIKGSLYMTASLVAAGVALEIIDKVRAA